MEALTDLIGRIASGARISVGGHHFARLPIAAVRALAAGPARDLSYFAWGGGLPLEMLLEADKVARIDLCFASLDIFGLPPLFRAAAETGAIPVFDWPALAMIQGLRAAQANLPFLPMQLPLGSDMAGLCPGLSVHPDSPDIGLVAAQPLDAVLLHAPFADTAGNVGIYGARALDLALVGAARQVLVTVDRIVPEGSLATMGRLTIIPRTLVTAIAVVQGGAWPSSCLPLYVTDYATLYGALTHTPLSPALALPRDGVPRLLTEAAALPASAIKPTAFAAADQGSGPATIDEIMVVRLAALLDDRSFASAGAVSPLANVAYRLAKATHAPNLCLATFSAGHIDVAAGTMTLSLLEGMDAETAVTHAGGDDSYWTFYQSGRVSHEIIGAAQVDGGGRVNNLRLTKPSGAPLRLAGQGGMSDVANMHRDHVLYITRHTPQSLVDRVAVASSARGVTGEARLAAGYQPGTVWLLTNLCLFRLNDMTGLFEVAETLPGVSRAQISEATGFAVRFADDCREIALPDAATLRCLRQQIDPLGLRQIEFTGARERGPLLTRIIDQDRAGLRHCLDLHTGLAGKGHADQDPRPAMETTDAL
jgi:glutaconate CoA-transferase, subunit A